MPYNKNPHTGQWHKNNLVVTIHNFAFCLTKNRKNEKENFFVVSTVALTATAAFVGRYITKSDMSELDNLLIENIEALSVDEDGYGYFVHHGKYYDPVTNLETDKCIAFCYYGPNGPCSSAHQHGAKNCCTEPCG